MPQFSFLFGIRVRLFALLLVLRLALVCWNILSMYFCWCLDMTWEEFGWRRRRMHSDEQKIGQKPVRIRCKMSRNWKMTGRHNIGGSSRSTGTCFRNGDMKIQMFGLDFFCRFVHYLLSGYTDIRHRLASRHLCVFFSRIELQFIQTSICRIRAVLLFYLVALNLWAHNELLEEWKWVENKGAVDISLIWTFFIEFLQLFFIFINKILYYSLVLLFLNRNTFQLAFCHVENEVSRASNSCPSNLITVIMHLNLRSFVILAIATCKTEAQSNTLSCRHREASW